MENLTPISIVSLFDTNKKERLDFVHSIIQNLNEGQTDPLKLHFFVKAMEDVVKNITSDDSYKKVLLEAAEKNGKKFSLFNAEFSIKEVGVKYDYTNCNDIELEELEEQFNAVTEKLKARQKFLQTVKSEGLNVINIHGEPVTVYPPSKYSTTSVAVTLK
jgi:hypothetical protein